MPARLNFFVPRMERSISWKSIARIQVEHPVTEMVTGVDIVKCQLEIASGHRLAMKQNEIRFDGHAIEARVYAENPVSFMPSPGTISEIAFPKIKGVKSRFEHCLGKRNQSLSLL